MTRLSSDRGAVFVHVALGLLFLLMMGAFVIDYGALWVSRSQAQSAADAGALAGAVAMSFDPPSAGHDRWDRGREVAWQAATYNKVWAAAPSAEPLSPYRGSEDGMTIPTCNAQPETCSRVRTYRDGTNASTARPTFLGNLFGKTSQGTRAIAVAQAAPASGSNCLKPVLIPDHFQNVVGDPNVFDTGDIYVPPTKNADGTINYGTGYTPLDIGTTLTLQVGDSHNTIAPGNYYAIDDPDYDITGGADFRTAWGTCLLTHNVGDIVSIKDGQMTGPTQQGFGDLIAAAGGVEATIVVGMFDPAAYHALDHGTGNMPIQIVNMLAFKVTASSMDADGNITGTIVGAPSEMLRVCDTPPCPITSGLVTVIRLVR
jgi:hypothetical protein